MTDITRKSVTLKSAWGGVLAIVLIALSLSSCSQSAYPLPSPDTEKWTVSIVNSPSEVGESRYFSQSTSRDFEIPEPLDVEGYTFLGYTSADGKAYKAGDLLEYSGKAVVVITAEWVKETSIAPSESSGISNAITSADGQPVSIVLSEGEYSESESISIGDHQTVIIEGRSSGSRSTGSSRAVTVNEATINGTFSLGTGSTLILRNVNLSDDTNGSYLISATSGGVTIELENSVLTTSSGGRGINVLVSSDYDQDVHVSLTDSTINMVGQNARGINVDGDSTQTSMNPATMLDHAVITLDNSSLVEVKDSTTSTGMVYAINIFRIEDADLSIVNGSRIVIDSRYYYAIRYYYAGSDDSESTVVIDDSMLHAWTAFYVQADSKNIKATITDSTLEGINQSDGSSDSFTTIGIDSSSNCVVEVDNCDVLYSQKGTAAQRAASIYYYDHTGLEGGNSISFNDCNFRVEAPSGDFPVVTAYYDNFITQNHEVITPRKDNIITFDSSTIRSLTSLGYEYSEEKALYSCSPSYTEEDAGTLDDDGYTKLSNFSLHIPAMENSSRPSDQMDYQFIRTSLLLSI